MARNRRRPQNPHTHTNTHSDKRALSLIWCEMFGKSQQEPAVRFDYSKLHGDDGKKLKRAIEINRNFGNQRPAIDWRMVGEKIETIRANRWCVDAIALHVDLLRCSVGTTATRFCVDSFAIWSAISLERRHSFCCRIRFWFFSLIMFSFFFLIFWSRNNNKQNNKSVMSHNHFMNSLHCTWTHTHTHVRVLLSDRLYYSMFIIFFRSGHPTLDNAARWGFEWVSIVFVVSSAIRSRFSDFNEMRSAEKMRSSRIDWYTQRRRMRRAMTDFR